MKGMRNVMMFSLGTIGRDMAYGLFAGWLMNYIMYTKGLSNAQFAAIGIIFAVCRVYDAVIDPFLGGLIENTRGRFGKFKPWIFAGMVLAAADVVLVFTTPLTGWSFVAFVTVGYLFFCSSFSMNDIAYWGMMPSLTSDPHERNKTATAAGICAATGGGLLSFAAPTLTAGKFALGGNAVKAYALLAIIVAVCFVGFQMFTLIGVKETRRPEEKGEKLTLKMMAGVVFKNDQLLWACLVMLLFTVGGGIYTTLITMYVYIVYGYDGALISAMWLLAILGFPLTIFMPAILKRFTRKKVITACVIAVGAGLALAAGAGFSTPKEAYGQGFWLLAAGGLAVGTGGALFGMIMGISIANTVEYNEWKTGERRDGLIFSLRPVITQTASAFTQLVQVIVFLALGLNAVNGKISLLEQETNRGLIPTETKNALVGDMLRNVPGSVSSALLICMIAGCALFYAAAFAVYRRKYTLDEKKYDEILSDIKKRTEV